jgi:hypothetical protein
MKKLLPFALLALLHLFAHAQDSTKIITDSIAKEGRRIYRSEMASWDGTDIFLEKFKDQRPNIGGYFSYADGDSTRCIFYSKSESPKVLGTITFDSSYKTGNTGINGTQRSFTPYENTLYTLRKLAEAEIATDTMMFKTYTNTSLNLVPLVDSGEKKVYVFTAPNENGLLLFGNDYLLTFNSDNKLLFKKPLHKNLISINFGNNGPLQVEATIHSHSPETGDFITATDICTLMLYEKFAKWKTHFVISENYVSIWDCEKNILVALTEQAWEKIGNDAKKRHKH